MVHVILRVPNFGKPQKVGDFEHLDRMCLPLFLAMLCSRPMVVFIGHRVQCKFHQLPEVLFLLDEGKKCDWRPYVYGILGTNTWFSVDFLLVKPTQWLQTVAACHGRSISNPHSKQHMFCVLQCLGLHWYCCGSHKNVWLVCRWSCAILQYNAQNMTMMRSTCQLPVMALSLQFSIPQKLQVYLAMYHETIPVITVSWAMWTGFFRFFFQPTFLRVRNVFRGRRGVMPGPWLGYGYGSKLDSPMIGTIWTKTC